MTRRDDDPQPGLRAKHDGVCPRCERVIHEGDRVARERGVPVHVECIRGEAA